MQKMKFFVYSLFESLLFVTLVQAYPPSITEIQHDLNTISNSLSGIVYGFLNIYGTLNICSNKSIGSLENAYTDWNPEGVYAHGDEITISCAKGFMTIQEKTEQSATCLRGNSWSNFQPCSLPTSCSNSTVFRNLQDSTSDWSHEKIYMSNDDVTITCNKGYATEEKTSKQVIKCWPEIGWSSILPCLKVCPAPFTKHGSLCLHLKIYKYDWDGAKSYCEALKPDLGSRLGVFKTKEDQGRFINFLKSYHNIGNHIWLGARDFKKNGLYQWADGSSFETLYSEFQWHDGEPSNDGGNQRCLLISYGDMTIYDTSCSSSYWPICQIPI